jgi:hypothetical protein
LNPAVVGPERPVEARRALLAARSRLGPCPPPSGERLPEAPRPQSVSALGTLAGARIADSGGSGAGK